MTQLLCHPATSPAPRGTRGGSEHTLPGCLCLEEHWPWMWHLGTWWWPWLGSVVLEGFSHLNNSLTHLTKHSKLISKYVQRYTMNLKGLNVISDELNSTASQDILITSTHHRFGCTPEKWGNVGSSLSSSPYQGHWTSTCFSPALSPNLPPPAQPNTSRHTQGLALLPAASQVPCGPQKTHRNLAAEGLGGKS